MLRSSTQIFAILGALTTAACLFSAKPIYYENDKRVALEHVAAFHNYLSDGDYERIYELFDKKVTSQQSKEQFIGALRSFQDQAGAFRKHTIVTIDVRPQADFRLVHIILDSEFDRIRTQEEFDCFVDGATAVFGFYGHPSTLNVR